MAVALAALLACAQPSRLDAQTLTVRRLATGFENQRTAPVGPSGHVVARTLAAWDSGWRSLGLPGHPPAVDFTRELAVLQATGFDSIPALYASAVDRAEIDAGGRTLSVFMSFSSSEGGVDTSGRKVVAAAISSGARQPPRPDAVIWQSRRAGTLASMGPIELAGYRWSARQRDSALAVLERRRALWASVRPRQYQYWENGWCFCFSSWPGPHRVTVRDARVVSATDTTGRMVDTAYGRTAPGVPGGIDALFDRIAKGIRDTAYAEVRVDYHSRGGYPTHVTFDRVVAMSDDEYYIDVSHFRRLLQ
jgi:hypothetical protein